MSNNDIIRQIREAAAFENAADKHDEKYENTMKSAGASMYNAFRDALLAQPEYKGRQIDERAVKNIYESTKPRPWWDELLQEAGYRKDAKSKETRLQSAARLIQWRLHPAKAVKARGAHIIACARAYELKDKQDVRRTRSSQDDQVPSSGSMSERAKGHAEPAKFEAMRESSHGREDRAPRSDDRARLLGVIAEIRDLVSDTPERLLPEVLGVLVGARDEISETLG